MRATWISAVVLFAFLTSAGCGGGGSSGPSQAPFIRQFRVAQQGVDVAILLDVFDAQADVFGGTCRIETNFGNLDIPIDTILPGANVNDPEADVLCAVRLRQRPPRGTTVIGQVSVIDRGGHQSNALAFAVGFEHRRDAAPSSGAVELEGGEASVVPPGR